MAADDLDTPSSRIAEQTARVQEALRTGDVSALRSSRDLSAYSWELSRLRRWEEADSAARRIEDDPEEQGEALALLAQRLAKTGAYERAIGLIDEIPDDGELPNAVAEKAVALVAIGKAVALAGRWQEVDSFFERAFASLEALGDSRSPWSEAETFLEWGKAYLSTDRAKALDLWRQGTYWVNSDIDCLKVLGEIGTEFALAGALEDATAVMNNHPLEFIREKLRAEIERQRQSDD